MSKKLFSVAAVAALAAIGVLTGSVSAQDTISNSEISLTVNADGSIQDVIKDVGGFWNYGVPAIGFGIDSSNGYGNQYGNLGSSSFVATSGIVGGSIVTNGAWGNLEYTRTYSLSSNNVNISTVITNHSTDAETFKFFDAGDPDQGVPRGGSFNSFNDVNGLYAIATNSSGLPPDLVKFSTTDPTAVLTFLPGLYIGDSFTLSSVFASPYDPNFADQDIGMAIIWERTLLGGQSVTLDYVQSYGTASETGVSVPEPSTFALLGLGAVGAAVAAIRRRRQAV